MTIVKSKQPKWVVRQLEMNRYEGQRKHSSQINQQEEVIIWKRLKSVKDWSFTKHALDRLVEKKIRATKNDIVSVINNSNIVEYKIDYNKRTNRNEERVVLHSKAIVNGSYNLKVVYSLTTQTVVTVWINHIRDKHDTLKWELYTADMKVFDVE